MNCTRYKTAESFRIALEQRIQTWAREEKLDLQDLRKKIAFDRFLVRLFVEEGSPWLLKGGYSIELQFKNSRSTKDVDLVLRSINVSKEAFESSDGKDLIYVALKSACEEEIDDYFKFVVKRDLKNLVGCPNGGMRYLVEAQVSGKRFVTFHVDISLNEISKSDDYVMFELRDWLGFAGVGASQVKAISFEQTFAEKLHAYTMPRGERPNSRVRDLVDMVLLLDYRKVDGEKLKSAIERVFQGRGSHEFPKILPEPPEHWAVRFPHMAESAGVDSDMVRAYGKLEAFLVEVGICEGAWVN